MRKPQKSYIAAALSFAIISFCFSACSPSNNEVVFSEKVNDQYASIVWADKEYVPYCAISSNDAGAYLGYMDGDKGLKVYGYRGYPSEEWIIQSGYGCAMLYREINAENIPDGLASEI